MMTCQCRLCHKCITLVGDADSGEALHCGGRDLWEVSVPSTQFCFKPKDPKSKSLFLKADIWRSQDVGGIGRGDHFLSYKFIKRITEHRANFTKQLLIASWGHQAPRKATHCLPKEVGQNIKDKKRDKRAKNRDPSREGSLNRGSFQTPGNPRTGGSGGSFWISEGNLTGRGTINKTHRLGA